MSRKSELTKDVILRRVHISNFHLGHPVEIGVLAFRPTGDDAEGISVSFADQTTPQELIAGGRKDSSEYGVVGLNLSDLETLGLSVRPDETEDAPPGHAFIPEINSIDYYSDRSKKQHIKELCLQLCKYASQNIVLKPEGFKSRPTNQ